MTLGLDGASPTAPTPSSPAASQAGDDDVEAGDDAGNDSLQDGSDTVNDCHEAGSKGLEERLDLYLLACKRSSVRKGSGVGEEV